MASSMAERVSRIAVRRAMLVMRAVRPPGRMASARWRKVSSQAWRMRWPNWRISARHWLMARACRSSASALPFNSP
jgi:hypothetical protein